MSSTISVSPVSVRRASPWARAGLAGFLFFLVKGLLWLALAIAAGRGW